MMDDILLLKIGGQNVGILLGSMSGIPDAPLDGKKYARQNGQWVETDIVMTESEFALVSPDDYLPNTTFDIYEQES